MSGLFAWLEYNQRSTRKPLAINLARPQKVASEDSGITLKEAGPDTLNQFSEAVAKLRRAG